MKIAVMGAGAVGCYFGALLARAGEEVTLVARPAHVHAIAEHGLVLETASGTEIIPVRAVTGATGVAGADIVLFCVKSGDTEATGVEMAPYLAPGACIITLQNGVDNAGRLQAVLDRPVVPAVVYVATEMAGPGHVRHHGAGRLVLGGSPEIARRFTQAGIPSEVSDNVIGALWTKLIVNCAYNAISAISQLPYGEIVEGPGMAQLLQDIVSECLAVAQASGVRVVGDPYEAVRNIPKIMPGQRSSTAQDLARKRPSEIDHLNGYVSRLGAELGVKTPVNQTLQALVRLLENRR